MRKNYYLLFTLSLVIVLTACSDTSSVTSSVDTKFSFEILNPYSEIKKIEYEYFAGDHSIGTKGEVFPSGGEFFQKDENIIIDFHSDNFENDNALSNFYCEITLITDTGEFFSSVNFPAFYENNYILHITKSDDGEFYILKP